MLVALPPNSNEATLKTTLATEDCGRPITGIHPCSKIDWLGLARRYHDSTVFGSCLY